MIPMQKPGLTWLLLAPLLLINCLICHLQFITLCKHIVQEGQSKKRIRGPRVNYRNKARKTRALLCLAFGHILCILILRISFISYLLWQHYFGALILLTSRIQINIQYVSIIMGTYLFCTYHIHTSKFCDPVARLHLDVL